MRASSSRTTSRSALPSHFSRHPGCGLRHSVDLAGRAVALSIDVPVVFDVPLAPHHRLIGRWAAKREKSARRYTRHEARGRIERVFDGAVSEILKPFELAELRVVVLIGDADFPPALAVICDGVGQLDLGWIEKSNVLRETVFNTVAPVGWQAAAYKALVDTLGCVLPVFAYDDMIEEFAMSYWDGEADDESARRCQIDYQGAHPDDIDEEMLPSAMNARRPAWMLAENAYPLKQLPSGLRKRLRRLREAHKAVMALGEDINAWRFETDLIHQYDPDYMDCSHLPSMTLVPTEHFARELDDVGRHGMEQGFMNIAGLCPLPDANKIDDWFASLKVGADLLLAAQDLINLDPSKP